MGLVDRDYYWDWRDKKDGKGKRPNVPKIRYPSRFDGVISLVKVYRRWLSGLHPLLAILAIFFSSVAVYLVVRLVVFVGRLLVSSFY